MYMPQQNYFDFEPEVLEAYRVEGKDIRGVRSFSALVPEVFDFGPDAREKQQRFFELRLQADLQEGKRDTARMREELRKMQEELRVMSEDEVRRRMRNNFV